MKQSLMAVLVLPILLVASASCGSPPPPPPGYESPVIDSVGITPRVVTPGVDFTVSVAASDDNLVRRVQITSFVTPAGLSIYHVYCDSPTLVGGWTPASAVVVDFTCSLPLSSIGGVWGFSVVVNDEYCISCGARGNFSVAVAPPN